MNEPIHENNTAAFFYKAIPLGVLAISCRVHPDLFLLDMALLTQPFHFLF
jgi:hypothetical protein